jgi:hypothetical protein
MAFLQLTSRVGCTSSDKTSIAMAPVHGRNINENEDQANLENMP